MKIENKTLDRLSVREINSLIMNSRTYGFMKYVMKNLKNGIIKHPEQIKVYYHETFGKEIVSWLLIDQAKELCNNLTDDEASAMFYTIYKYRRQGLMGKLVAEAENDLKGKVIKVYVEPYDLEYAYIKRLGEKYNLVFQSHITTYNLHPIERIETTL